MKKLFWSMGIFLVLALILPFPKRIVREYEGIYYADKSKLEPIYSSVLMDGWLYNYMLRQDEYRGKFEILTDDRTVLNNAKLVTSVDEKRVSYLTYLTDLGYITLGYLAGRYECACNNRLSARPYPYGML